MKLFKKIRQSHISQGELKKYFLYSLGEILLVMIGISLAFQVDNWNDRRIKQDAEVIYYENLQDQISEDKKLLLSQVAFNNQYRNQFNFANEILKKNDRTKMDTLGLIIRNFTQYSDFDRQGNIYETLVNSGEIKILRNYRIINKIRTLEEKYLYVNRIENIHYDAMMSHVIISINNIIKFSTGEIQKPEVVYNYEFQNLLLSLLQIMTEKDKVYHEALKEIGIITSLIDEELKSK
ncbi:DUF6090 family protein [Eudoraea chungangensis]|uniref:DUF6090 family protein n=1 Tax=Eudoraea chungangensis TaxID=1481905 RepID=UPI0023ECDBAF|nr:DUF6090 family protein [Eudoraea chungangensis]